MLMKDGFLRDRKCLIDRSAHICPGAVLGKRFRPLLDGETEEFGQSTDIGPNVYVGYHVVVGCGSKLDGGVVVDDYSSIESDVVVGEQSLVIYRAHICNEARIGRNCVIGGFVAERVTVGDGARLFGKVVHTQHNPTLGWDSEEALEKSATIQSGAFLGFDSIIIGDVTIGERAYVCAGAILTKDVPARHIAFGNNRIVAPNKWKGQLKHSPLFDKRID